jgi:light-regulated signal transduction histidine kinase (bacteriophytochrome)
VNLDDLTICDREPITRLDRVQSFGFLLALSTNWVVTRVSSNLQTMLGIDPLVALGRPLDEFVDIEALHDIRNRLYGMATSGAVERLYGVELVLGRPHLDLAVHRVAETWILEGEPAGLNNRLDAAAHVRKMVARLATQPTLDSFHADAAKQVRTLTGFDRVLIYRFAPGGSGEVIAEAMRSGMAPYLGLHYPAGDIPLQARALYLRNPFRIIADIDNPTSVLLGIAGSTHEPLDLSFAVTRAVSPVHIEYLRGMGVLASLSISIIVQGKLWGLVACHNETPKLPSFVIRSAAELFGLMYSMTLESRELVSTLDRQQQSSDCVARIIAAVASNRKLLSNAGWLLGVLDEVIPSDGVAVCVDGLATASGVTPTLAHVGAIAQALQQQPPQIQATDHVAASHPDAAASAAGAAGMLSIPISRSNGDYILLFRKEQLQEITWAGQPTKADLPKDDPRRLSPRKSFAVFAETIRGRSRPFTGEEQRAAEMLRAGLIEIVLRGSVDIEAHQAREGNRQEILIAELNHRVRNVLALIRGLISQTQGEAGDSASYVKSLSGRVQALARAHDRVTRQDWGPGPLNAIFEDEIAAYVPTQRDRFTISGPFVFLLPQAYSTLALVVHELVTNSSKYGALSDNGRGRVTLRVAPGEGLFFQWLERDGPPVSPPTRQGFGTVIIQRVIPFDLRGTATVSYDAAGIRADFFVPEEFLADGLDVTDLGHSLRPAASAYSLSEGAVGPLAGLDVLLLEDNLIVALEAEELLLGLGALAVRTVSSVAEAQARLTAHGIGFAVLDINLGLETSFAFAAQLRSMGIPFVFTSGYGEGRTPTESPLTESVVAKPYDRDSLGQAIVATLQGH